MSGAGHRGTSSRSCARWTLVAFVVGAPLGCAVENPDHVQDSTGVETGWRCERGHCSTEPRSYSPPPVECEGERTELLVGAGAIAILCAVGHGPDGADLLHEATCRPLVCADSLDCPQWTRRPYACVQELCQVSEAEGWTLDRVDMTALCLWDVPRHADCAAARTDPLVADRLERVEEACADGACTSAPEPCLSP